MLSFRDGDGHEIAAPVETSELHRKPSEVCARLADVGMSIMPGRVEQQAFAEYLIGHPSKKRAWRLAQRGWAKVDGQMIYATRRKIFSAEPLKGLVILADRVDGALRPHGDLDGWKKGLATLAEPHQLARLAISTALAGSLLELGGFEGGGINFGGASGTGKTTISMFALSVDGDPSNPGPCVMTWDGTFVGFEISLFDRNDACAVIDEAGKASDFRRRSTTVSSSASASRSFAATTSVARRSPSSGPPSTRSMSIATTTPTPASMTRSRWCWAPSSRRERRKHYGVIYADPPWRCEPYSHVTGLDRDASNHYPVQPLDEIKALDVVSIAAADCVLFLWTPGAMTPQALEIMAAWGFEYRSQFVWAKDRTGTGYWNRNQHELLLVGVRGDIPAPAQGSHPAPVGGHSAKPNRFYDLIETHFPTLPKIELFARKAREGWARWGFEAPSD